MPSDSKNTKKGVWGASIYIRRLHLHASKTPFFRPTENIPVQYMEQVLATPRLLGKCYSIRITLSLIQLPAGFVQDLLSKCHAIVACEHAEEGKRTHIHLAIINSVLSHDPLRKYINMLLKDVTTLEGNSLLSVKKWDLSDRYLVYIIKGENPFIINTEGYPEDYISAEEWICLKNLWVSQSVQENDYSAFKASEFYPNTFYTLSPESTLECVDVKKCAVKYALQVHGGYINAKVRYLAKDLISNYCLFNEIKMAPVYI